MSTESDPPITGQSIVRSRFIIFVIARLAIGVCAGVAWHLFGRAVNENGVFGMELAAGGWYTLVWSIAHELLPKGATRSPARHLFIAGLIPVLAIALSVIGIWFLPWIVHEFWWLVLILAIASTAVERTCCMKLTPTAPQEHTAA